jgi:hypothetical protein
MCILINFIDFKVNNDVNFLLTNIFYKKKIDKISKLGPKCL